MIATLGHDLRGLRDRAILLIGFAGGLRRSEIIGLDCGPDQTEDGTGWIEILGPGHGHSHQGQDRLARGRDRPRLQRCHLPGRRPEDLARSSPALPTARCSAASPRAAKKSVADRLTDRHVARLVKRTALAAGIRGDLSEDEREEKFSGHSLRAGLASSAEVDERHVQKQLGHASAEMTRRYQRRRDRFRVNLTKAAGL